jgi:hypothetical protein
MAYCKKIVEKDELKKLLEDDKTILSPSRSVFEEMLKNQAINENAGDYLLLKEELETKSLPPQRIIQYLHVRGV